MTRTSFSDWAREQVERRWRARALSTKALSFALVGVVNTVIDYSVFLLARAALAHSPAALAGFNSLASTCGCGDAVTI